MSALEKFKAYDFNSDEKWQAYLLNIEVPAGRDEEAAMTRVKAKWFKRNIDPDFNVNLAAPLPSGAAAMPSQAPRPRQTSSAPSSAAGAPPGPTGATAAGPQPSSGSRPSATPPPPAGGGGVPPQLLLLQIAMLLCLPMWLQPFRRSWSCLAYSLFLQMGVLQHGYKVYLKYGLPRLRPFSLAAISQWFGTAAASADLQYALQCALFVSHPVPQVLAVVSPATLALYHVAVAARHRIGGTALWAKHGARAYCWLADRKEAAMLNCALSEIMLGFNLAFGLLGKGRSIFLLFGWWNVLKMRYFAPDFSTYHYRVWQLLGQKALPYIDRLPPLKKAVEFATRWFTTLPQQQPH